MSSVLSKYGTEQCGISAEIAIADHFGIPVSANYRLRGRKELVANLQPLVGPVFEKKDVPAPTDHIAEGQNPVDFSLKGEKSLSVKSNMRGLGKIAPQKIGQPTSATFWKHFSHLAVGFDPLTIAYEDSKAEFKKTVFENIVEMLGEYWDNLFGCDYLIVFSEILTKDNLPNPSPEALIFDKVKPPVWEADRITFTRSLENWNESCTVKYDGVSIAEFQVHNNRNCFKFRFIITGLKRLKLI